MKKLLASDAQTFDQFGVSVAVSGDTAVVGASFEGGPGYEFGAAYVFQRNKGRANTASPRPSSPAPPATSARAS